MQRRGKRIAAVTMLLAVVSLTVCGFLFSDRILEAWYLQSLSSDDEAVQATALEWLVSNGTLRITPTLIDLIHRSEKENVEWRGRPGLTERWSLTPVAFCLYRLGPAASPHVNAVIDRLASEARMSRTERILHSILDFWRVPPSEVSVVTYSKLAKIREHR